MGYTEEDGGRLLAIVQIAQDLRRRFGKCGLWRGPEQIAFDAGGAFTFLLNTIPGSSGTHSVGVAEESGTGLVFIA